MPENQYPCFHAIALMTCSFKITLRFHPLPAPQGVARAPHRALAGQVRHHTSLLKTVPSPPRGRPAGGGGTSSLTRGYGGISPHQNLLTMFSPHFSRDQIFPHRPPSHPDPPPAPITTTDPAQFRTEPDKGQGGSEVKIYFLPQVPAPDRATHYPIISVRKIAEEGAISCIVARAPSADFFTSDPPSQNKKPENPEQ